MATNVLVVDDEIKVKRLFELRFRKEIRSGEVTLHFAFSGVEALQILEHDDFQGVTIVLADINMPKMNGLELLKIIKEKFSTIRVFMITAYGDQNNHSLAMELGAQEYFVKPVDFKHLKECLFNYSTTEI